MQSILRRANKREIAEYINTAPISSEKFKPGSTSEKTYHKFYISNFARNVYMCMWTLKAGQAKSQVNVHVCSHLYVVRACKLLKITGIFFAPRTPALHS